MCFVPAYLHKRPLRKVRAGGQPIWKTEVRFCAVRGKSPHIVPHKNESDKIDRKERKTEKISSPLKGEVIALSDVQDEAFSSGALGLGAAVDPKEGVLYAPADGTISVFFPTGHAIGMTTDDGVELLIHVGMDTVQLEGKGFRPFAKEGDRVTKGQKLLEFDMELICKEGYSLVTPVLITNTDEFSDISITSECHIDPQSILMTVTR